MTRATPSGALVMIHPDGKIKTRAIFGPRRVRISMKTSLLPQGMRSIGRRGFVKTAGGAWVISLLPRARLLGGAEVLQVLRGENLERLRLDFNAGRGKVRILSVLSPT